MARLSAIQLCSVPNVEQNLLQIEKQLALLPFDEDHVVVLPECCLYFGGKDKEQLELAKRTADSNQLESALAKLASRYGVILVAGTIPLLSEDKTRFTNSSCLFTPTGQKIAQYDKIHLFDVNVQDNEKCYRESKYTQAGNKTVVEPLAFAKLGLSVCYDLRFPELYRTLRVQGADIITVPSAFTRPTGKAHWQALLQARAIENQVYIIAAGQEGVHENGRKTWGHSMIISPWGEVLVQRDSEVGYISTPYQQEEINKIRSDMPVFEHNQFITEFNSYE